MKTKLLLIALVAALAIPMQGQNFRHSENVTVNNKSFVYTSTREVIPEGMVKVTLAAGDVWGDGSGYQMLLDADANTYGTIIPTSGPLSLYSSVSDAVYAEFEYKIPENADGSLYTENYVCDDAVSILIPAGTYDWCITNPEYAYAMWIASDYGEVNGRNDDFVFEAGNEYIFTAYMTEYGYDGVSLEIVAGEVPPTPTEKTQTPDGSYAVVSGQHEVVVTITPYEGDVFYRIIFTAPDGTVTEGEWLPYVDSFSVYEDGRYRIEFYAVADGKLPSDPGAVEFTVSPMTGVDEMTTGKTVAGVRYFNMAGQEMTEANGMTIVVTTYTDGTTNAVKVMK